MTPKVSVNEKGRDLFLDMSSPNFKFLSGSFVVQYCPMDMSSVA